MQLDTMLYPVGLTVNGKVLKTAAYLAARTGAILKFFHVVEEKRVSAVSHLSAFELPPLKESARHAVQSQVKEAIRGPLGSLVDWTVEVEEGEVGSMIAKAAEDPHVELLVMGFKRGSGPWAVHWLDEVLRRIRKPVLAVPLAMLTPPRAYWRRIILATDLSSESTATQGAARALARMSGAEVTIVFVNEKLPPPVMGLEAVPVPPYREFALEEAQDRLDAAFKEVWPDAQRLVLDGSNPGTEIAVLAQRQQADLIVVGYNRNKTHLLGAVADRLLNESIGPVLVVPHTGFGRVARAA